MRPPAGAQDLPEEDGHQVARRRSSERETMTTPSASMPTKSRPMAVSDESRERRVMSVTPPIMASAPTVAPTHARRADEQGGRDARQHAVRQRITDEGQAAQHHEGADDRAGDGDEHTGQQRAQHEPVVQERVDERTHGASGGAVSRRTPDRPRIAAPDRHGRSRRSATRASAMLASMKVTYEPSSGRCVAGQLHDAGPGLAGDGVHDRRGVPISVKMTLTPSSRICSARSAMARGRDLALGGEAGDDGADQLEVVAVGEVAHRLVAGDQLAGLGRGWPRGGRGSPRRAPPGAPRGPPRGR